MKYKKTIHIPTGLHEELKKECKRRGLVLQYQIERLIINQLSEWIDEQQKDVPFDIPNPYKNI